MIDNIIFNDDNYKNISIVDWVIDEDITEVNDGVVIKNKDNTFERGEEVRFVDNKKEYKGTIVEVNSNNNYEGLCYITNINDIIDVIGFKIKL